jgi:hypothetical protein
MALLLVGLDLMAPRDRPTGSAVICRPFSEM